MINLNNCTFIIPLMVEHQDRYRNAKTVLSFLNHHFKTNVMLYEVSETGSSKLDFIKDLQNLDITHKIVQPESYFHRTKYLNIMLDEVVTPVVVNYDIDVILPVNFYKECVDLISDNGVDVIYPYRFGHGGQMRVLEYFDYDGFISSGFNIEFINSSGATNLYDSEYGHCIFFKTSIYKKFGAENENFISYGPEDKERGERFKKMGFDVRWIDDCKVYHFEHFRGIDSSDRNPHSPGNWGVFYECQRMDKNQIIEYYKNQGYNQNYKTIGKW